MDLLVVDGDAGRGELFEGEFVDGCGVLWVLVVVVGYCPVLDGILSVALVGVLACVWFA